MQAIIDKKNEARDLLILDKFPEALAKYTSVLEDVMSLEQSNPERATLIAVVMTNMGLCEQLQNNSDAALAQYQNAYLASPRYEKAAYREAKLLFELSRYSDCISVIITKIKIMKGDEGVQQLIRDSRIKLEEEPIAPFQGIDTLEPIFGEEQLIKVETNHSDGTKTFHFEYSNQEAIKTTLNNIGKLFTKQAHSDEDFHFHVKSFVEYMDSQKIQVWKTRLTQENFEKVLSVFAIICDRLNHKFAKCFDFYARSESWLARFTKYIWHSYITLEEETLRRIIMELPVYYREIPTLLEIAKELEVTKQDVESSGRNANLTKYFFESLSANIHHLSKTEEQNVKAKEQQFLKTERRCIVDFTSYIAKCHLRETKSFLVVFFGSMKDVNEGHISDLLFDEMTHLYHDGFSFESIFLMNCISLIDHPNVLNFMIEHRPMFVDSVILLLDHLNYLITKCDPGNQITQFKLEHTFQLLISCLSSNSFLKKVNQEKGNFFIGLKRFLENSYIAKSEYTPTVLAKSILCTTISILELFPNSLNLLDEFASINIVIKLLSFTQGVKESKYDESEFVSDTVDILCYIAKSEEHSYKLAKNDVIFKKLGKAIKLIDSKRHLILHSTISLASALLTDRATKNYEIAHNKWGADMEGFKTLEQLREKVSAHVSSVFK